MSTIRITPSVQGKGTGNLSSYFFDEEQQVFKFMVNHLSGSFLVVTPVDMEPGKDAIIMIAETLVGWLDRAEIKKLYDLAFEATATIVEIGSFMGRSTTVLGWAARLGNGVEMHAIDPHKGGNELEWITSGSVGTWPTFYSNMQRVGIFDHIIPHRETSRTAAPQFEDGSIDLVFIDGDHASADQDFDLWDPKLRSGGIMVFHDSSWPVVAKTIDEEITNSDRYDLIDEVVSMTIAKKR